MQRCVLTGRAYLRSLVLAPPCTPRAPQSTLRWNTHSITRYYSSSTTTEPPSPKSRQQFIRSVSTFDPAKLSLADYLDFSGYVSPNIRCGPHFAERISLQYQWIGLHFLQFPSQTRGYLYYDRPPPDSAPHPASGALKFRVATPNPDVQAAFSAGHDLHLTNRWDPWKADLLVLRSARKWRTAYELLLADRLVTHAQDQAIERLLPPSAPPLKDARCNIRTILDPFPLYFNKNTLEFTLLDPEKIAPLSFETMMASRLAGRNAPSPYSGVGLVRFEAAPPNVTARHPTRRQDPDEPVLAMRFLSWLEPPQAVDAKARTQIPGTLVEKYYPNTNQYHPWTAPGSRLPPASWQMLKARGSFQ